MLDIKKLRIVFMGTPEFACAPLSQLINDGFNVVAVVSQPDKPVGRKKELKPTPVKALAMQHNIDVLQPLSISNDYQCVLDYQPDCVITCAYGQKVPNVILDYPKYLCINLHGSLLPSYRGGAPMQRCLINGDKKTGMTLMQMVERMDAGDMFAKEEVDIDISDTYDSLALKMMEASKRLIHNTLPLYFNGECVRQAQDDSLVSIAYTIKKEEELVSFTNEDVVNLYNHMRGLISNPAPYAYLEDKKVKFFEIGLEECEHNLECGVIVLENKHFKISAKHGYIHVYQCQMEGKSKMDALSFANGIKSRIDVIRFK